MSAAAHFAAAALPSRPAIAEVGGALGSTLPAQVKNTQKLAILTLFRLNCSLKCQFNEFVVVFRLICITGTFYIQNKYSQESQYFQKFKIFLNFLKILAFKILAVINAVLFVMKKS